MKTRIAFLFLVAVLICGCGRSHVKEQGKSAENLVARGGWKIEDSTWKFELRHRSSTELYGSVRIETANDCLQGALQIEELDGMASDYFKATWDEVALQHCQSGPQADTQVLSIDARLVDKIAGRTVDSDVQWPRYALSVSFERDERPLNAIVLGSESWLIKGDTNAAILPILHAGSPKLKAIAVSKYPIEPLSDRIFDPLQTPIRIRPVVMDEGDRRTGEKYNQIVCLNQVLLRQNEREAYQKLRPTFWSGEEHRRVLMDVIRNVNENKLSTYAQVEGAERCLK